jgi:enamine deaminase RidA (YjgF/YER057c/UK114 family)
MIHVSTPSLTWAEQFDAIENAYTQLRKDVLTESMPVIKRYFLSDAANQANDIYSRTTEGAECAISIIEQPPLDGTKIAMWVYLMTDVETRATDSGLYEVKHGIYRHLWNASAHNLAANSEFQTRLLLNEYIMQLAEEGCTLKDSCIRTWFYVNNIDLNYGGVVRARNQVFLTQDLTPNTHFIASTGIGGRQADPNVLVQMDNYAIAGITQEQIKFLYAPTHLNRTSEYGVSFERGTSIEYGDRRHVFISGTASINNKGEIMHPGNIVKQTERMWENVEQLLKEADCTFDDMAHVIVYLRDIADYHIVKEMFSSKFPAVPCVITLAPVCRPGWLVEMECMAVRQHTSEYPCY